jgi:hypothetical protein
MPITVSKRDRQTSRPKLRKTRSHRHSSNNNSNLVIRGLSVINRIRTITLQGSRHSLVSTSLITKTRKRVAVFLGSLTKGQSLMLMHSWLIRLNKHSLHRYRILFKAEAISSRFMLNQFKQLSSMLASLEVRMQMPVPHLIFKRIFLSLILTS